MSTPPRISVVVPFFNRQDHIGACIESLLGQDDIGGPVEIILVDNRSSDASVSIAKQYPAIVLLSEATAGAYAARNTGIRRAAAPLVAFTDADCVVARDWLASIWEGMRDPAVAMTIGACDYPAGASAALRLLGVYENAKADYVASRCPPAYHFAYANNMAVRASAFQEVGLFREWARAADTELVHRLAAARPDLRLTFNPSMRVTHLEFLRLRDRLRRLSLYTTTNAKIPTFRELDVAQRTAVLLHMLKG